MKKSDVRRSLGFANALQNMPLPSSEGRSVKYVVGTVAPASRESTFSKVVIAERKASTEASVSMPPVDIDSGYPSDQVLETMLQLKTPKLVRMTKSMF